MFQKSAKTIFIAEGDLKTLIQHLVLMNLADLFSPIVHHLCQVLSVHQEVI